MDSRDITQNPVITENFLNDMFSMQKALLNSYQQIESLPDFPINLHTKSNQTLLKDFTSRVVEELAEGWEAMEFVLEATRQNRYWSHITPNSDDKYYLAMLNHLQNVGEELADAMHFFLELLIYANISTDNLKEFATKHVSLSGTVELELLTVLQNIGENWLNDKNQFIVNPSHNNVRINKGAPTNLDPRYLLGEDYAINLVGSKDLKICLWDVTAELNISRNFLKNKPWKQSSVMTAEGKYKQSLMTSFVLFCGTLKKFGIDATLTYFLYFKKNQVNQFRIKSKY